MRYYKLFNKDELHYSHQYHDGLNIDKISFNPTGKCSPGGFYFFNEVQLSNYARNIYFDPVWIRQVHIPLNALVYHEKGKSKASRLFLDHREEFDCNNLDKYIDFTDKNICLMSVQENAFALRYVKEQTIEICIAAIQKNREAIKFVNAKFKEPCDKLLATTVSYTISYLDAYLWEPQYGFY